MLVYLLLMLESCNLFRVVVNRRQGLLIILTSEFKIAMRLLWSIGQALLLRMAGGEDGLMWLIIIFDLARV